MCRSAIVFAVPISIGRWFNSLIVLAANNVRSDGKHRLVLRMILRRLPKEIFQDRNLRQPRNSGQGLGLRIVQDSANQARFPVLQPDFMLDFLLADDGLADAADARLAHHRGNFHR